MDNTPLEIVKELLSHHAETQVKNLSGEIPLHLAAINGRDAIIKMLIEYTPYSINEPDAELNSPLHLAVQNRRIEAVQGLLQLQAARNTKNRDSTTPLHIAIENRDEKIVSLLLATEAVNDKIVHTRDRWGNTPLHHAALKGNVFIIRALLEKGAQKNMINFRGQKPYDIASNQEVKQLLDNKV